MWFADIGLTAAVVVLAAWAVAVAVAVVRARMRGAPVVMSPGVFGPGVMGSGAVSVLFLAQAAVVDAVEDAPGGVVPLDASVWAWFVAHRTPAATGFMTVVSAVGGTAGAGILAAAAAALLVLRRHGAEAIALAVAAVGASLLVVGFKSLYGRPRPPVAQRLTAESNAALPSGHSLGSVVVLSVLAVIVVRLAQRRLTRALAVAAAGVAVLLIGVSRLYLGVHWATDVLTGWLLGGAWAGACVTALLVARSRTARAGAAAPAAVRRSGLRARPDP